MALELRTEYPPDHKAATGAPVIAPGYSGLRSAYLQRSSLQKPDEIGWYHGASIPLHRGWKLFYFLKNSTCETFFKTRNGGKQGCMTKSPQT